MLFNMKKPAAVGAARGPRVDLAGRQTDPEDSEALLMRQARALATRFRLSHSHASTIAGLVFGGGAR